MKPPNVLFKLNANGSALDNPGSIGAGGILRNSNGDLIFAYYVPLGHGTNNQAEVEAAVFGLSWCVQLNYQKVVLEVDSQMLVDWLLNKSAPPWNISSQMQQLHTLTTHFSHFKCIHTLREANFVADSLSKHSHQVPNYTSPASKFQKRQQLIFSRTRQAWQVQKKENEKN
ncbi:uncharacterized protein [Solanum tuberosum]|uniref:uncharacterized protein n=1 Tax=Solanum tuberosum TaxID=4113 RepID=UPI00073A40EB|nr:PREDICTED: uncharacterized protein LOC107060535 [Solanum tuberosum]